MDAPLGRARRVTSPAWNPAIPWRLAGHWLLLLPALSLIVLLFLVPTVWLARMSLFESGAEGGGGARFYVAGTLTFEHYRRLLTDRYFHSVALSTLQICLLTGGVCMALAYPLALWLERSGRRTATLATWLVALPKLTNALVLLYGVLVLLGNAGLVNRFLLWLGVINAPLPMFANLFAVLVGEVLLVLPYPTLLLLGTFRSAATRSLEVAAQGLGAGPIRAYFETTFRLTLPATALVCLVTLVWGAGAFVAPLVLGNPSLYTASVEIHTQTFERVNWPMAAALSMSQLGAVGGLALFALAVAGKNGASMVRGFAADRSLVPQDAVNAPVRVIAAVCAVAVIAFLVGPLVFSVLVSLNPQQTVGLPAGAWSFRWYRALLSDPLWLAGLGHSLVTAGIAAAIALPTGTLAAIALDRLPSHLRRHGTVVTLLLIAPLFVPGVVLGLQSLALFQRLGIWGKPYSLGLAHAMWTMPLAFLAVRAALTTIDRKLEEAAEGLGAHPVAAFCLVTLPRLWPALAAAAFLCAIMSLNELPMALFLATPAGRTLPTLIWPQLRYNLTPLVAAASGVLLALTVGGLLLGTFLGSHRWQAWSWRQKTSPSAV
ncbi:MAG TPA: ABC transporter permease subunit [Chloroflexota bacterium]|nr:ABC transporter permease subunit [Chloroflexota bacterium]